MSDLLKFGLKEMTECGIALRNIGTGAGSMEEVADRIVRHIYDRFTGEAGDRHDFALVRLFKTHPYRQLSPDLREFAAHLTNDAPLQPETKCLTLLATVGDRDEWNSRKTSARHKAIPMLNEKFVLVFPMISNLVAQLGLGFNELVRPDPKIIMDISKKRYNVFHVGEARGSAVIPGQDNFVVPYGIKSALGFGGVLPSGNLFVVIAFSKVPLAPETAKLFETLSLNIKLALLPFEDHIFA